MADTHRSPSNRRAAGCAGMQNHQVPQADPSSFNLSINTESSTEAGPIFQAAHDCGRSNQTTHVQWTHDYAYLLGSRKGHRCSCKGFFFLGILLLRSELMESFPTSSTEESHSGLCQQDKRERTAPSEPATHSVEAKAFTILLRLCSTARYLFPSPI